LTLALAFGRADVGRFLTELSVDEFRLWQEGTKLAMMRTAGFLQLPGDERRLIIAKAKEELASRSLAAGRRVGAAEILNEERKG
jgi:hypothetical protein